MEDEKIAPIGSRLSMKCEALVPLSFNTFPIEIRFHGCLFSEHDPFFTVSINLLTATDLCYYQHVVKKSKHFFIETRADIFPR